VRYGSLGFKVSFAHILRYATIQNKAQKAVAHAARAPQLFEALFWIVAVRNYLP